MIHYKHDVVDKLLAAGYSQDNLPKGDFIKKLKNVDSVDGVTIDTVCRLLQCQPGDILEYVPDGY